MDAFDSKVPDELSDAEAFKKNDGGRLVVDLCNSNLDVFRSSQPGKVTLSLTEPKPAGIGCPSTRHRCSAALHYVQ